MTVKINSLELEDVKRIRAIALEPSENGLTVIGGRNGQGKTSVLDAIAWALGGDRFRPSSAKREGSHGEPMLRVTLSNGIVAERRGENSSLKVTDPTGRRGGQTLLNEFIGELALNLPKFLESSSKEKAQTLLRIIGIEKELCELDIEEQRLYAERHGIGQLRDRKHKHALELPYFDGVPTAPISVVDLIKRQQDILAKNGENMRKREKVRELRAKKEAIEAEISRLSESLMEIVRDLETASLSAQELCDTSTAELEREIADIDNINVRVRANLDRERALAEAEDFGRQYSELTDRLEDVRQRKIRLLDGVSLPLPNLSVENGELLYNGKAWDCMSASDQLKVATAIVRRIKPECGFVLIDKLEQMDRETLRDFGEWLESEGLQAIATRVSVGEECTVIIEDGIVTENSRADTKPWTEGEF